MAGVAIVVCGLVSYHNSFSVPFLFDDVASIVENPTIRHLWPIGLVLAPQGTGITVAGRPIVNLSLAINYALGGLDTGGYHALNLLVHIFAGLVLFGIVRRTLLLPGLNQRFGAAALPLALATALLWTVHPLQTESVTYVIQRAESIMGLLYLLTLYGAIRAAPSANPGRWYAVSVIACLLGMAGKEVMVTAPLMVFLYDRTFLSGSFAQAWRKRRGFYLALAGTWLLLGYLLIIAGNRGRSAGFGIGIAWDRYAFTQFRSVTDYLLLSAWPHPLVLDYGVRLVRDFSEAAPYALVIGPLLIATGWALWRRPALGFLGAWFFGILAPSSGLVPVATESMAEHRMYLPLAAVIVLAVLGAFLLGNRLLATRQDLRPWTGWGLLGTVTCLGMLLTVQRNNDYRSALAIWQDTVAKFPDNPRSHYNLAMALADAGRTGYAIEQYRVAILIAPNYAKAHNNLGNLLAQTGDYQGAIAQYREALRYKPDFEDAQYNLTMALQQQAAAVATPAQAAPVKQAPPQEPPAAGAYYRLGLIAENAGNVQQAIHWYEQALQINPDFPEVNYDLGVDLYQTGQNQMAIDHLEQAVRAKPDYAEAHSDLAIMLAQAGRIDEAIAHFTTALRFNPDDAEAQYNMALVLSHAGRQKEAIPHYREALRIRPDFPDASNGLQQAESQTTN